MFDVLTGWISAGGLPAIFALMLLENVFPPIPSELIMPLAGFEAAAGRLSVLGVILAGTAGSVLGALFWYGLARAWGRARFLRFVDRWGAVLTLTREEAEEATAWFHRHGRSAVLLGRLVPTIRTLISVPAGLSEMPLRPFLLLSSLGSLVWTSLLTLGGYLLEDQYERIGHWLDPVATGVVLLVVGLYLYRLTRALLRRR